jgi:hypothetical protein
MKIKLEKNIVNCDECPVNFRLYANGLLVCNIDGLREMWDSKTNRMELPCYRRPCPLEVKDED